MPYNAMALPPHGMMVTSYQNDHADDWRIYVYDMVKKKNISHVHKHHTIQKINIDADNNSFLETNPPTCNWR